LSDGADTTLRFSRPQQRRSAGSEVGGAQQSVSQSDIVYEDPPSEIAKELTLDEGPADSSAWSDLTEPSQSTVACEKPTDSSLGLLHHEISTADWKRAYGHAYALTRNTADAEDAAQEAYLRLFQRGNRGEPIESRTAWLRGVLRYVLLETYRKIRPDLHVPIATRIVDDPSGPTIEDTLFSPGESIENQLVEQSLVEHSLRVISELSPKERECVLMYAQGYTFVQISKTLGVTYKVALTTTKKALIKVKKTVSGKLN
jgi:RNA polymerase sigma-70 factor (ECF subfamily)